MKQIRIGYVPLTDAAVLVAAAECGFAENRGLKLVLKRENSWATLRDKLALGHVDGAHLLAPLAIASAIGLGPGPRLPLSVPFVLNRNGNSVAVSMALWREMGEEALGLHEVRTALGRVGRARNSVGRPLRLATVFPYSTHTYLLRKLLDGSGLVPDRDVGFTVVPPPYSAQALMTGAVDAVCVGAPWASVAVEAGAARIVLLGPQILPEAPEKVLALPRGRLPDETVIRLVAALKEAAIWCAEPANRPELAALLGAPRHLNLDTSLILRALEGRLLLQQDGQVADEPAFLRMGGELHRPDPAIADWILGEMEAAGQIRIDENVKAAARALFEPHCFDCI